MSLTELLYTLYNVVARLLSPRVDMTVGRCAAGVEHVNDVALTGKSLERIPRL